MSQSRIPSPARSHGAITPRRHKPRGQKARGTRSVGSPARSTTSGRLSAVIQFQETNRNSFVLSPAPSRRSVLNDDTYIDEPRRRSWWKKLGDNSRDVMEVLKDNKILDTNEAVEEYIDIEVLSQEKKNYTIDLPDSSDSESISSIVIPQRKLFTQKDLQIQNKFGKLVGTRESLAKLHKSNAADKTVNVAPKNLFSQNNRVRTKPVFPAALLNISADKTANKTKEMVAPEVKGQVRNLFGNRGGQKRKNMFADFIVSDSEEEIPEIQPKVFGFQKKEEQRRESSNSRGKRNHSPTSSISADIEMDEWQHLPSSTMVENQIEDMLTARTPVKRPRLSKLANIQETEAVVTDEKESEEEQELKYDDDDAVSEKNNEQIMEKEPQDKEIEQATEQSNHDSKNIKELPMEDLNKESSATVNEENVDVVKENMQDILVNEEDKVEIGTEDNQEQDQINDEDLSEKTDVSEGEVKGQEENDDDKKEEEILNEGNNQNASTQSSEDEIQEEQDESEQEPEESEQELDYEQSEEEVEEDEQENEDEDEKADQEKHEHDEEMPVESEVQIQNDSRTDKETEQLEQNVEEPNVSLAEDANKDEDKDKSKLETQENKTPGREKISEMALDSESRNKSAGIENKAQNVMEIEEENEVRETEVSQFDLDGKIESVLRSENEDESDAEALENENEEHEESAVEAEEENEEENAHSEDDALNESEMEENNDAIETEQSDSNVIQNDSVPEDVSEDEVQNESEPEIEDNEEEDQEESEVEAPEEEENNEESENEAQNESKELQYESDAEQSETEDAENISQDNAQDESENEIQDSNDRDEIDDGGIPNATVDTTGRNRKKNDTELNSPEAILHDKTKQLESFTAQGRNTSIRKTTLLKNLNIRPSLAPPRESTDMSDGTRNSSVEGSGWDSHRTTRKTLRQTFGKDFTPRKSLRAMVMEQSAKRKTGINDLTSVTSKFPQANSTELPEATMGPEDDEVIEESNHDVSKRTRQTSLEMYLQKIKKQNIEKKMKMEEAVRNSLKARTTDILNPFKVPARPMSSLRKANSKPTQTKAKAKPTKTLIPLDNLPPEVIEDMKYKPPRRFQPSNAAWITKRLYKFLESKLESKYDYKARVRAEKLVETIYQFTVPLRRQDAAAPAAADALKLEMARLDVVRTHFDFYQFFHDYMPREIRVKVVPDVVNKIGLPRHGVFSDILRGNTVQG